MNYGIIPDLWGTEKIKITFFKTLYRYDKSAWQLIGMINQLGIVLNCEINAEYVCVTNIQTLGGIKNVTF